MEIKKLNEYQENGTGASFAIIEKAEERTDKRGKTFVSLILADQTNKIDAKIWNATAEDLQNYEKDKVVYFEGKKETFDGRPQMRLLNIRLATQEEPNNPQDYKVQSDVDTDIIRQEIDQYVSIVQEDTWRNIVKNLLMKYDDKFYTYPAAKYHHHAFLGGLSLHTVSMLRLADGICDNYAIINRSLLYSGIILHDLGKVLELSGVDDTYYTLEGNLCGHIVLIDEEIVMMAKKLGYDLHSQEITLLKHMILAHHGKLEYGSPVRPQIVEAEVINHIDMLDATMQMLEQSLLQTTSGEYSLPISGLDNRSFYKH